ncbi:hypothetical protein ACQU0X_32035 [Pseudovibrio ascidiaceicola]|uniref:hypothetical protein n=1 Tax=Pseudovibrio ascidiaceicola TaxID=285279 RepID=UPI003D362D62
MKEFLENLYKPKPKLEPKPRLTPLPSNEEPSKSRPKRKRDECCEPVTFLNKWPVGKKKVSLVREIGWFDWGKEINGKKIEGWRVICNRGFWFQLEVTETLCAGLEYKCKDESGKIGPDYQYADGLNPGLCNMVEVKYALHEQTYTAANAKNRDTQLRRKLHRQFRRYATICNDPRRVPELKCLSQVGLEIFVNWKTMAGFYEELMSIYGIPGPAPEVRLPRNEMRTGVPLSSKPKGVEPWMDELSALD